MGQDAVFPRTLPGISHIYRRLVTTEPYALPRQRLSCCLDWLQDTRLEDYRNYLNLKDEVDAHQEELVQECLSIQKVIYTFALDSARVSTQLLIMLLVLPCATCRKASAKLDVARQFVVHCAVQKVLTVQQWVGSQ